MDMAGSLLKHRIITLDTPISAETANPVITQMLLLDAEDSVEPIELYINSPGGSVLDGLAIIDAMQCIQAPVSTICLGRAASMAAWLLAAGTKGRRFAAPNAEVMIHGLSDGLFGEDGLDMRISPQVRTAGFRQTSPDQQIYQRRQEMWQKRLVAMLARWTGRNSRRIETDIRRDLFLSAQEAKAYGIVDEILEPFKEKTTGAEDPR